MSDIIHIGKNELIHILVQTDDSVTDHTLNTRYLRPSLKQTIKNILQLNVNPDLPFEQRKVQAMMSATVKGILTMTGDTILASVYKSKDHPRPAKNDDIIEWYLTFAVDKFLDWLLMNNIVFNGKEEGDGCIALTEIHTRSATESQDSKAGS